MDNFIVDSTAEASMNMSDHWAGRSAWNNVAMKT
jgi:hypothetical protein